MYLLYLNAIRCENDKIFTSLLLQKNQSCQCQMKTYSIQFDKVKLYAWKDSHSMTLSILLCQKKYIMQITFSLLMLNSLVSKPSIPKKRLGRLALQWMSLASSFGITIQTIYTITRLNKRVTYNHSLSHAHFHIATLCRQNLISSFR